MLKSGNFIEPSENKNGDWEYEITPVGAEKPVHFALSKKAIEIIHEQVEKGILSQDAFDKLVK